MEVQDVVDAWVQIFVASVWPVAGVVGLLLLRDHFPAIGLWIREILEKRAFSGHTPFFGFRVEEPTLVETLEADAAAAQRLARETPDFADQARLISDLTARAETAVQAAEDAIRAPDVKDMNVWMAARIAERALAWLEGQPNDLYGLEFGKLNSFGQISAGGYKAIGDRGYLALLHVAWASDLADVSDTVWEGAARFLVTEGYTVRIPPFQLGELALVRGSFSEKPLIRSDPYDPWARPSESPR